MTTPRRSPRSSCRSLMSRSTRMPASSSASTPRNRRRRGRPHWRRSCRFRSVPSSRCFRGCSGLEPGPSWRRSRSPRSPRSRSGAMIGGFTGAGVVRTALRQLLAATVAAAADLHRRVAARPKCGMTVRELIRAAGLGASALRPGNLSGGVAASRAVHGPPGPEPAGRRGDPEVAPKEGRRSSRRSCSPSTTLRPARSSARADGRCSVRACWRAVTVTNRSNRCARIARSAEDGTTIRRGPSTRRTRCRSAALRCRWNLRLPSAASLPGDPRSGHPVISPPYTR